MTASPDIHSSAPPRTAVLWNRRWHGKPGRLEVWYATFTDRRTGTGLWLHGEHVAPSDGGSPLRLAWAALFPHDSPPVWQRTSGELGGPGGDPATFECDGFRLGPVGSNGTIGELSWDLGWDAANQHGLATFGELAWTRNLLPAAQVVPAPNLAVDGWIDLGGQRLDLSGAHGAVARIYGHGNAERWGWLHADLGDGDLIELVSAVSTRPGLNRLPPITFVRFRIDGRDWPASMFPAVRMRAQLGRPDWHVVGHIGRSRVRIDVHQDPARTIELDYHDPDGRTATCANSEQADLAVEIVGPSGRVRRWKLSGTAHAEIGTRP